MKPFRGLDTRWQIGRTSFEPGELALARTNTAQARDCFGRALVAFEAMGAAPDVARTRAALERVGKLSYLASEMAVRTAR